MDSQKQKEISPGRQTSSRGKKRTKTTSSTVPTETEATPNPSSIAEKGHWNNEVDWVDSISPCPVFSPTMEEFQDPLAYLQTIAPQASNFGICKIVSPWKASISASDVLMKESMLKFKALIQRLRFHGWKAKEKETFHVLDKTYDYRSFEEMANKNFAKRISSSATHLSPIYIEKEFWREMSRGGAEVLYGLNIEGSAFSSDPNDELGKSNGNLKTFTQLSNCTLRLINKEITGITTPMLYIAMLFSLFAWHVEDHYLYSINYHHSGAPKIWYGVPGAEAPGFEKVVQDYVYAPSKEENGVSALLAEKTTMFSPYILLKNKVSVYKAVQMAGEYVITFPRAYHAGFSQGFSCGEAVNFAVGDWFPWGEMAGREYARLCKMAILPYEELLCKEAVILSKSSDYPSNETTSQLSIKNSFLSHVDSLENALRHLNNLEASFRYSPNSQGTDLCQLCKRDYYVAFLQCHGCSHSTCLFHDVKSLNCECMKKLVVFIREDIWEVVEAYEKLGLKGSSSVEQDISSCIKHGLARHEEWEVSSFPENCKRPRTGRRRLQIADCRRLINKIYTSGK